MSLAARLAENWQLKLLSVAFAVTLWAFVSSEDKGEAVYTVPLDLTDRPAGAEVTSVGVETLVVRVQGLRSALARLREEDLRAEVSLRDVPPGRFVVKVGPRNVRTPRGVRVVRVTPSQVQGMLEPVTRTQGGG